MLYFHLIDQLGQLLQSYDYDVMMEQCRNLKASDHNDIKLFTGDQMKIFSQYDTAMLLRKICLFSWSNCSILRALINDCSEATKLLDKFESYLVAFKCVDTEMVCTYIHTYVSTYSISGELLLNFCF